MALMLIKSPVFYYFYIVYNVNNNQSTARDHALDTHCCGTCSAVSDRAQSLTITNDSREEKD